MMGLGLRRGSCGLSSKFEAPPGGSNNKWEYVRHESCSSKMIRAFSRIIALLKGVGHATDCAKDGETALFLVESEPCGLIILDIGLPRMSGSSNQQAARAGLQDAHSGADRPRPCDDGSKDSISGGRLLVEAIQRDELSARVPAHSCGATMATPARCLSSAL